MIYCHPVMFSRIQLVAVFNHQRWMLCFTALGQVWDVLEPLSEYSHEPQQNMTIQRPNSSRVDITLFDITFFLCVFSGQSQFSTNCNADFHGLFFPQTFILCCQFFFIKIFKKHFNPMHAVCHFFQTTYVYTVYFPQRCLFIYFFTKTFSFYAVCHLVEHSGLILVDEILIRLSAAIVTE